MLLFIDESGQDNSGGPYEVLAGAVIEQANLWNLVKSVRAAERALFGDYLRNLLERETKAKALLKHKRFASAARCVDIGEGDLAALAHSALLKGQDARTKAALQSAATERELVAYSRQALAFVHEVLDISARHGVRFIASVVDADAPRSQRDNWLTRDMVSLMDRYYRILEARSEPHHGLIVCDELEKSKAKHLVQRMAAYFLGTTSGNLFSSLIVPEPFFVHSELTTGVFLADLAAYLLSWGWRLPAMTKSRRQELDPYVSKVEQMRYDTWRVREGRGGPMAVHGFRYLTDMRYQGEETSRNQED